MSTLERLTQAGVSRIVTTDTVRNKEPITKHIVPVAPIFAAALQEMLQAPVAR